MRCMCGIGAVMNIELERVPHLGPALEGLDELLAHRGPDGHARWRHERGHVGFAHRRLSIIGLERGDQPMRDAHGNWITYNGEIYNYLELRKELGEASFETDSDTEVILRAYARWGPDCLDRLRGMFAFALWDETRAGALRRARPLRDQAALLRRRRRNLLLRLGGEGPDPVPAGDRDRSRRAQGLSRLPVHARRQDDVPRRARAPAGSHADDPERIDLRPPLLGSDLRARPGSHGALPRRTAPRDPRPSRSASTFGPTSTSAATSAAASTRASSARAAARQGSGGFHAFTGRFDDGEAYDESRYARALAEAEGIDLHQVDVDPGCFRLPHPRRRSTRSTSRSQAPGRFRSTSSRSSPRSTSRSCWVARVGTRSSAVMRAICSPTSSSASRRRSRGRCDRAEFVVTYASIIPNLEHASGVQAADAGVLAARASSATSTSATSV